MFRRWLVFPLLFAALASTPIDLDACGDKFVRVGRGARFRGYAAVHRAAILIYVPATANSAGVKELEALLKRAGHRPVVAQRGTSMAQTAAHRFDLVIATYTDALAVRDELRAVPARPDVLPILYKASREMQAEAKTKFSHLLVPDAMSKVEALAEIDRLMERRHESEPAVAQPRGR